MRAARPRWSEGATSVEHTLMAVLLALASLGAWSLLGDNVERQVRCTAIAIGGGDRRGPCEAGGTDASIGAAVGGPGASAGTSAALSSTTRSRSSSAAGSYRAGVGRSVDALERPFATTAGEDARRSTRSDLEGVVARPARYDGEARAALREDLDAVASDSTVPQPVRAWARATKPSATHGCGWYRVDCHLAHAATSVWSATSGARSWVANAASTAWHEGSRAFGWAQTFIERVEWMLSWPPPLDPRKWDDWAELRFGVLRGMGDWVVDTGTGLVGAARALVRGDVPSWALLWAAVKSIPGGLWSRLDTFATGSPGEAGHAGGELSLDIASAILPGGPALKGGRIAAARLGRGALARGARALSEADAIAARLVRRTGRAGDRQVRWARREVARLPIQTLRRLEAAEIQIPVGRGNVADMLPALRAERPRGWPEGTTWSDARGIAAHGHAYIAAGRYPVLSRLASSDPRGVLHHEIGHALDRAAGGLSQHAAFEAGYTRTRFSEPYFTQPGRAGREEAFAESFALHVRDPAKLERKWPELAAYWRTDPLAILDSPAFLAARREPPRVWERGWEAADGFTPNPPPRAFSRRALLDDDVERWPGQRPETELGAPVGAIAEVASGRGAQAASILDRGTGARAADVDATHALLASLPISVLNDVSERGLRVLVTRDLRDAAPYALHGEGPVRVAEGRATHVVVDASAREISGDAVLEGLGRALYRDEVRRASAPPAGFAGGERGFARAFARHVRGRGPAADDALAARWMAERYPHGERPVAVLGEPRDPSDEPFRDLRIATDPRELGVSVHGEPDAVHLRLGGDAIDLDHRGLATWIRKQGFDGRCTIRLFSCTTGHEWGTFAQNLSNKLGVDVIAPTRSLWVLDDRLVIGWIYPSFDIRGEWRRFRPDPSWRGHAAAR